MKASNKPHCPRLQCRLHNRKYRIVSTVRANIISVVLRLNLFMEHNRILSPETILHHPLNYTKSIKWEANDKSIFRTG